MKQAKQQFRAAIEMDPTNSRPYGHLMVDVLGPAHDLNGMRAVGQQAIAAGADPVTIEQAEANAASAAGDPDAAEAALVRVSEGCTHVLVDEKSRGFLQRDEEIRPRDSRLPARD